MGVHQILHFEVQVKAMRWAKVCIMNSLAYIFSVLAGTTIVAVPYFAGIKSWDKHDLWHLTVFADDTAHQQHEFCLYITSAGGHENKW